MRLILVTLILAAIAVYVYIDYDNIHAWITGEDHNKNNVKKEEIFEPVIVEENDQKDKGLKTKFKDGDVVYIDASVGDTLSWEQNEVPLWITYDGSDQDDKQSVKKSVPHRLEVKVIKAAIGRNNETWYYIRTAKGLPISGWIREVYLSKELPKRRRGENTDWGR